MASGHEYRANRPNTWLLRPRCKVKILLANPEPSTHGPSRQLVRCSGLSGVGGKADLPAERPDFPV